MTTQVPSSMIASLPTVQTADLAALSVTTAKLADANVTPAKLSQPLTLGTSQASTSGTSIDFTSIPSWVKRITVMLNGVSTNGVSLPIVQLGSGSPATTGYAGRYFLSSSYTGTLSSGFVICAYGAATEINYGSAVFTLQTGNTWVCNLTASTTGAGAGTTFCGGSVTLSGVLDRIRITTVNGTDTFDAGSINILYE